MLELQVVDAFADTAFSGNPAAVTVLDHFPPDDWMQKVAREMNLAETAFLVRRDNGDYDLRWLTPLVEVDLCGHATLASAHALGGTARFHTRSGLLSCRSAGDGLIEMSLPADVPVAVDPPLDLPGTVAAARGRSDYLIEVEDETWLREHTPDIPAIAALDGRALIVTTAGGDGVDFVSRVFCPSVGIDEDPVTGSAHCTLAGYWSGRTGRISMTGFQASARGGTVYVRVDGDRVTVSGRAVTVSEVRMLVEVPSP